MVGENAEMEAFGIVGATGGRLEVSEKIRGIFDISLSISYV